MDRFGQIGPEKGDYAEDVAEVARRLQFGSQTVACALTHLGTRQQVVLAMKDDIEVYGAGPEGTTGDGLWLFCAVDTKGAYWFRIDHHANGGYIASALGVTDADGETLSGFFALLAEAMGTPAVQATSRVEVFDGHSNRG